MDVTPTPDGVDQRAAKSVSRRAVLTGAAAAAAGVLVPLSGAEAVPSGSGSGRRIVYSRSRQRVWVVGSGGGVLRTYLVSGRLDNPPPGTYRVFSKSYETHSTANPNVRWNYMVRFYRTKRGNNIGFHQIPVKCSGGDCYPVQSESQLGSPRSNGCIRQSRRNARWLYNWAGIGTKVVVLG